MSRSERRPAHYRLGGLAPQMRRLGFGGWADYRALRRHHRRAVRRQELSTARPTAVG